MLTLIERNYQILARQVIARAIDDATKERKIPPMVKKDANRFLNNTQELQFYAEIGDCKKSLVKAGYIKK